MGALLTSLALSLGLTLILELAVALLLGVRKKRDLLLVFLVNVLTNPVVVLVLNLTILATQATPPWYLIFLLETGAVLTEGLVYRHLEYRRIHPFLFSLILNAISCFGGLIL